ncbi:MAG: S8 family serine peptidase, partial [candidate division Zixibacteria bacterium]|nr:S8 family serine peptidase [candidate division Zixibacteria bacterium]
MCKSRYFLFLSFFLFITFTLSWGIEKPLVSPKDYPVISPELRTFLSNKPSDEKVKVWVYFTDKGIFDQESYVKAKSRTQNLFPVKSLQRRAKVLKSELINFLDLPVHQLYVENIKSLGAKLRQPSRWLNAVSFEVSQNILEQIALLPFVKSIKPVLTYIRKPIKEEVQPQWKPLVPINYGPSYDQLQQINVPAVHALGYHGEGVLVCMMDTGFRKDHKAFKSAFSEGRVLAEYDFINLDTNTQNEPGQDASNQHNHGTYTWSTLGGEVDGQLYGPAYEANFILAKTEYVPTETRIEEDNWVAGMEWADSIGADVISSSLGYLDFD